MRRNTLKSQSSEINLENVCKQSVNYLDLAEESCLRFQTEIRKHGIKTFNVWKYLESEFKKAYIKEGIENRQPPKASTISQWFDPDPINGTKMGTEDLRLICKMVNDPTPIMAYYEQALIPFEEESPESLLFDLKN